MGSRPCEGLGLEVGRGEKQTACSPGSQHPSELQTDAELCNTPERDHWGVLLLNYHQDFRVSIQNLAFLPEIRWPAPP